MATPITYPPVGGPQIERLLLDTLPTLEEIFQHIINARYSTLTFPWPEDQLESLDAYLVSKAHELGQANLKIRRFEYDFESATVYLNMKVVESNFHSVFTIYSANYVEYEIEVGIPHVKDENIQRRLRATINRGTGSIVAKKSSVQADWSLGCADSKIPRLICEEKARRYFRRWDSVQVVFIIDIAYPSHDAATVSLLTRSGWVQHREAFFDGNADEQPAGQVGLYYSDLIGPTGLPPAYCRSEALGPNIVVPFEVLRYILTIARNVHTGKTSLDDYEPGHVERMARQLIDKDAQIIHKDAQLIHKDAQLI
ncbi:hypothetical protein B0T25DRAFT_493164, partial [Lasiosphaeria hispida]